MKALLFFGCLLCVGCGTDLCADYPNPFDAYFDFSVKGLCVSSNHQNVKPEMVAFTLTKTEQLFNIYFPDNPVAVEPLLKEHKVNLIYMGGLWRGVRGSTIIEFTDEETNKYYNTTMFVLGQTCWLRNYVMAHELLHVIAHYHLKVTSEENVSHMVEKVFFYWSRANNLPDIAVVEEPIAEIFQGICLD